MRVPWKMLSKYFQCINSMHIMVRAGTMSQRWAISKPSCHFNMSSGWCRVPPSDRLQDHGAQTQSNSAATPHERNMAAVRPYGTFVWFRSISKPAHIQSRRQAIPHWRQLTWAILTPVNKSLRLFLLPLSPSSFCPEPWVMLPPCALAGSRVNARSMRHIIYLTWNSTAWNLHYNTKLPYSNGTSGIWYKHAMFMGRERFGV